LLRLHTETACRRGGGVTWTRIRTFTISDSLTGFLLKRLEPVALKHGNGVGRVQDLGFAAGRVRPGR
jgi:hypothetical protein